MIGTKVGIGGDAEEEWKIYKVVLLKCVEIA